MSTPEDNLPPVQPPSAGFLMQLFVVPMVIVVVIIGVCLMFNWLAHMGSKPQELVDDLSKLNPGSWQKALTIANLLTDRQQADLRKDADMAQQLADVLDKQLDEGSMEAERIKLRVYLCLALGVFEVENGFPELLKAAGQNESMAEREVQLTALEAISTRLGNSAEVRAAKQTDATLLECLSEAARQRSDQPQQATLDARIRERAAFAYGVLGGKVAQEQLAIMISDAHPTVRYNAATGLARQGDVRSVPRLVEMLKAPAGEPNSSAPIDEVTRFNIMRNAMRATVQLIEANPSADVSQLKTLIESLTEDRLVAMDAKLTLQKLKAI